MRQYLFEMSQGPGTLRLLLQPLMSIAFGIVHGLRDQHQGRRPYLCDLFSSRGVRMQRLAAGLREILIPLGVAVVASLVFQYVIRSHVYLVFALLYATLFVAIPYFLARSVTNRIAARRWRATREET